MACYCRMSQGERAPVEGSRSFSCSEMLSFSTHRDSTGHAVVLGAMVHTYAPLHRVTLGWHLPWRCLGRDALPTHTWGHLPTNASLVLGCIHSVLFSRGEKCPLGISKASPGSERRGSWLPHLSYPTSSNLLWVLPEGP